MRMVGPVGDRRRRGALVGWVALVLGLTLPRDAAAGEPGRDVPRMLPRPVHSETVVARDGRAQALIVAPSKGPFADAGSKVQELVRRVTGTTVPLVRPSEVTGRRGLLLTPEAKGKNLVFVGNLAVNPALFEPYVRRMLIADEADPGPGKFRLTTHPNPWGTGAGLLLVGASEPEGLARALEALGNVVKAHGSAGRLVLPRLCQPGPDALLVAARSWKRLARPRNEEWLKGFKKSRRMHLGYHVGGLLFQFTLITDLGCFTAEELNDIENEVLENILMIPRKVWWYRRGGGSVGGRHELFKNPRLYLACEHLLRVGRPNDAARRALEELARGPREYMRYCVTQAYRSDHEGIEDGHAWQSALWFALVQGDWAYFESGLARDAAFYGLLQTDNLGGLAGHVQYGGVADLYAASTVRNAMRAAAWWYRDGRFRWLLANMPFEKRYPYGFPLNLPLSDIPAKKPEEWLGVQWLPLSPHSYQKSVRSGRWQQPRIRREKTVDLLTFREGFGPDDQYLCVDGFQNHYHPLGLNSALRYVDRGKLFLVSHTGKEGNYYKSGVVVSRGVQTQPEPWGAELVAAASLPHVGLAASRFPNANGCDWTRWIFWKRGEYFLFLDELVAREPGEFNLTATWRTGRPAELTKEGWRQKQDEVTFWVKPAFALDQRAGQAPPEEYQNEVVPYLLRQALRLSANAPGARTSFQNVIYATGPGDEQSFEARRVSPTACLVRGSRTLAGKTTRELALLGVGERGVTGVPIKTDAALFYVSPDRAAFADGTTLRWRGVELAARKEAGDIEVKVPQVHRQKLKQDLEALWESVRPERKAAREIPRGVELGATWTFQGFRDHPRRVTPLRIETSADGGTWTCHLEEAIDLEQVAIVQPRNLSLEQLVVEFSTDGFRQDVRRAAAPPERSTRIVGPHGKSFFTTQLLLSVPGQRARSVRVRLTKWKAKRRGAKPSLPLVELCAKEREPAAITRIEAADLDGDGRPEVLALTRDNQFVVLGSDGRKRWQHSFQHNIMSLEALDVDADGKKEILACDAASDLHFFGADGSRLKTLKLTTSDNIYQDFFRSNRAYALGLWRPKRGAPANVILGTYQSIAWIAPDDQIVCWPPKSDELPYRSGYVWRGLIYWERTLPRGLDLNGDGVEDQAFIGRGWATKPSVMFFDSARHDALAEHGIPSGRPLGLEVVRAGGRAWILAVNEFHLGLYSTEGGKELWRVRFDTPAAAYTLTLGEKQFRILVAKRDGVVLVFDPRGKILARQLLPPELAAVAPIRIGEEPRLLVSADHGITILTPALQPVGYWPPPATKLTPLDQATVLAACPDGQLIALHGK